MRTTREEVHQLVDLALGDDPKSALYATRRLSEVEVPWLEERSVSVARTEGWSWGKIGQILGRSRQSIHERYGRRTPPRPHVPPDDDAVRQEREFVRHLADIRREREPDPIAW